MSAILGNFLFDLVDGDPPPALQSSVDLFFRPGQGTAAAKVMPIGSRPGRFSGTAIVQGGVFAHQIADLYRTVIGEQLTLYYHSVLYGTMLVVDVQVTEIKQMQLASGVHPDGTVYSYAPAARIQSRWDVVRL